MFNGNIYMGISWIGLQTRAPPPIIRCGKFCGNLKSQAKLKFIYGGLFMVLYLPISGQCLVCAQGAEDVKHLIFTCNRARDVWESLGLKEIIQEASVVDRSGSAILEEILLNDFRKPPVL
jgi:hypothetical protein